MGDFISTFAVSSTVDAIVCERKSYSISREAPPQHTQTRCLENVKLRVKQIDLVPFQSLLFSPSSLAPSTHTTSLKRPYGVASTLCTYKAVLLTVPSVYLEFPVDLYTTVA